LTITGIAASSDTGSGAYVPGGGSKSGSFSGGTAILTSATITFTVGTTFTGDALAQGGPAAFTYVPAASITDAAGNAAAGSLVVPSFRLF
jgi:hypothetical protein